MAATDDLRAIAERTERELDAVHDFFEYSKIVWLSFKTHVDQGHKISAENPATGTRIDQDGLVRVAPQYTREYLVTFTFRQFVSTFEAFLFDFLHRLLLHNPWQFSEKQLDFGTVLRAASRDEIVSGAIRRQLNELRYEHLREWFATVNKAVKLDCPAEEEIDALAEIKAARDILEHNAGVANEIYRRKAGKRARYEVGDHVELEDAYHLESWRLIKKVVQDVTSAAIGRLSE
ncbi:MAG: hypothetical protein ACRELG_24910 [Gemmataceae bacterium]